MFIVTPDEVPDMVWPDAGDDIETVGCVVSVTEYAGGFWNTKNEIASNNIVIAGYIANLNDLDRIDARSMEFVRWFLASYINCKDGVSV